MKRILTLIAFVAFVAGINAQVYQENNYENDEIKTLLGSTHSHGGYGAIMVGYSELKDLHAITIGGRGAWIVGHSLAIGMGGQGFVSENEFNATLNEDVFRAGGYGGLLIEPILLPKFPVHLSFPVLMGAGGVAYTLDTYDDQVDYVEDSDAFLFVQPGVELELNVVRFMRIAFSASYRITTEIELIDTDKDALTGLNFGIVFKFGKF